MYTAGCSDSFVPVCQTTRHLTEQIDVKTLWTPIWEVLGLSPSRDTYRDWSRGGFLQSLRANVGIVPRLGHSRFLPNPFQLCPSVVVPFDGMQPDAVSVLKTSLQAHRSQISITATKKIFGRLWKAKEAGNVRKYITFSTSVIWVCGSVVGWSSMLKAGRSGFSSRWGHWIFQLT
jgi:hypothetical protein